MTNHRPQNCPQHTDHQRGCATCRAHASWYFRTRKRLIVTGQWTGMVDATEARNHASQLIDAGMCRRHIGEQAGITEATIADIVDGHRATIYPDTAAAVLGVKLDLRPNSQVPAIGVTRRVRAMIWQGHSRAWIASESGVAFGTIRKLAAGALDRVTLATRERVVALLRNHIERPPADSQVTRAMRREATSKGWVGPGAWNDIDDPADMPDLGGAGDEIVDAVAVAKVVAGEQPFKALRDAERVALFQGPASDWSYSHTSKHLRMSPVTIDRWRARAAEEQVAA